MLDVSNRIWLKDGTFVQLCGDMVDEFENMLADKLGREAANAFREIVANSYEDGWIYGKGE